MDPFADTIRTPDALRDVYEQPNQRALEKEIDHLDHHCRAFIAHSPIVMIGTSSPDGMCEVSPRGGAPGWAVALDDRRLLLPDDRGNNRLDALTNIVETGQIGLLFLVPERRETLRVNGRAWITTDPEVLARAPLNGKTPPAGIGVEVRTAFLQCGKALVRSKLWEPGDWPDLAELPSSAEMRRDHGATGMTVDEEAALIQESYAQRLTW